MTRNRWPRFEVLPLLILPLLVSTTSIVPPARAGEDDDTRALVRITMARADSITAVDVGACGGRPPERRAVEAGQRMTGTLIETSSGLFRLQPDDDRREILIPRGSVARFETSAGRASYSGVGALAGMAVCGVAAWQIMLTVDDSNTDSGNGLPSGRAIAAIAGVGGGLIGLGLGALVGSAFYHDDWIETAPVGLSMGGGPRPGEWRVGVTMPLGR